MQDNYQELIIEVYIKMKGLTLEIPQIMQDCFAISRIQNDIYEYTKVNDLEDLALAKKKELNKILEKYPDAVKPIYISENDKNKV